MQDLGYGEVGYLAHLVGQKDQIDPAALLLITHSDEARALENAYQKFKSVEVDLASLSAGVGKVWPGFTLPRLTDTELKNLRAAIAVCASMAIIQAMCRAVKPKESRGKLLTMAKDIWFPSAVSDDDPVKVPVNLSMFFRSRSRERRGGGMSAVARPVRQPNLR